jgi:hypothetical protein
LIIPEDKRSSQIYSCFMLYGVKVNLIIFNRIMEQLQQYGKVGIITHLSLSWSFFLGTYLVVNKTNYSDQIIKYLKLENRIPAKAGSFVISGIIYKAVMPVRIGITLLALPLVVKFLGSPDGEAETQVQA